MSKSPNIYINKIESTVDNWPKKDDASADKINNAFSDIISEVYNTIHYLSPASSSRSRSIYEGAEELDYLKITGYPEFIYEARPRSESSESEESCVPLRVQRTLAIIKPDAMKYKDVVLRTIFESGLDIIAQRTLHLTPEQVAELYAQHYGNPSFPLLVVSTSVEPALVLALSGINAIGKWKTMVKPYGTLQREWFFPLTVRLRFGLVGDIPDALHYSRNHHEAVKENRYIFANGILEPILDEELKVTDYCGLYVNPTLSKGLVALVQRKPIDPVLFLAEWLLLHNPFQPRFPDDVAMTPT